MTDYYPDQKYYKRYCKLCILCCDKRGTIKYVQDDDIKQIDQNINKSDDNSKVSIDTHSQLRVIGSKIKVQYQAVYDNDDNNVELAPTNLSTVSE